MRFKIVSAAILAAFAVCSQAARIYSNYDSFYAAQPGAVFSDPVKRDSSVVYSDSGERGVYTEMQGALNGEKVSIRIADRSITINGSNYRFADATTFPGEHRSNLNPQSVDVFLATPTGSPISIMCLQGDTVGSGEADRHKQVYLLVNPFARKGKPTFLHLPSLFASCRAVLLTKDAKLVFPKNSYLFDNAEEARVPAPVVWTRFCSSGGQLHQPFLTGFEG
ncbi:hypothetical protein [Paraburkholderia sp. BL10I2N1]|uniref:hypothetical protein n=1 Tax=Paraburkholderia sp. BL10I2N1 TaxID=1938796 RepID=UPI00105B2864|nr:hypothetical protein [Paraburkholderia sp. BL10I2N1]TDN61607.1 hypothetical protein B0G77_5083 [Paraburkholderia sp. BL10I2N1]